MGGGVFLHKKAIQKPGLVAYRFQLFEIVGPQVQSQAGQLNKTLFLPKLKKQATTEQFLKRAKSLYLSWGYIKSCGRALAYHERSPRFNSQYRKKKEIHHTMLCLQSFVNTRTCFVNLCEAFNQSIFPHRETQANLPLVCNFFQI